MPSSLAAPDNGPSLQEQQQLENLLRAHLHPSNQTAGAEALRQLEHLSDNPVFPIHLVHLLAYNDQSALELRQAAGLLLKNMLRRKQLPVEDTLLYVKQALMVALHFSKDLKPLRNTAATAAAAVITNKVESADYFSMARPQLEQWPEFYSTAFDVLDSQNNVDAMEGFVDAILKISEEAPLAFENILDAATNKNVGDFVVPRLLNLFGNENEPIRFGAINTIHEIYHLQTRAIQDCEDQYLERLCKQGTDSSCRIRKFVCRGLVQILEYAPHVLEPVIHQVIEYILSRSASEDPEEALEASEFWVMFCDQGYPIQTLIPVLDRLITTLLKNMEYEDDDEAVVQAEIDSSGREEENLQPYFSRNRGQTSFEFGGEIDNHEEDDNEDGDSSWNLRKCSGYALDQIATACGERGLEPQLLSVLLPLINSKMQSPPEDWKARESAVLAIGAISHGCAIALRDRIPELVRSLSALMQDSKPLVQSISCWAFGRLIPELKARQDGAPALQSYVRRTLDLLMAPNGSVREAACAGVSELCEEAAEIVEEVLSVVVETVVLAFSKYSRKDLRKLYDTMTALVEALPSQLDNSNYVTPILTPMIQRLKASVAEDKETYPLMECISIYVQKLGHRCIESADWMFGYCVTVIELHAAYKNNEDPKYDREAIVCSLDMMSSIIESLGDQSAVVVRKLESIGQLLIYCAQSEGADVRQVTFALVGDLAKVAPATTVDYIDAMIPFLANNLNSYLLDRRDTISVVNNACWALGEISASNHSKALESMVPECVSRVIEIAKAGVDKSNRTVIENCAITLGRLVSRNPGEIAPHLDKFIGFWLNCIDTLRDGKEKEDTARGLCSVIKLNANGAVSSLPKIIKFLQSFKHIQDAQLKQDIQEILQSAENVNRQ